LIFLFGQNPTSERDETTTPCDPACTITLSSPTRIVS
jgi:hypothetical protein